MKNIKPLASGPSDEPVKAQSQCSEQPSWSLPGLPVPDMNPYDENTEIESDVPVETLINLWLNQVHLLQKREQLTL